MAVEASLPAHLLGLLQDLASRLIARALPRIVPSPHTSTANFGVTSIAFSILPAIPLLDSFGFDPLIARFLWAVNTVPGRILLELAIPIPLKFVVEKVLNILDGNGV